MKLCNNGPLFDSILSSMILAGFTQGDIESTFNLWWPAFNPAFSYGAARRGQPTVHTFNDYVKLIKTHSEVEKPKVVDYILLNKRGREQLAESIMRANSHMKDIVVPGKFTYGVRYDNGTTWFRIPTVKDGKKHFLEATSGVTDTALLLRGLGDIVTDVPDHVVEFGDRHAPKDSVIGYCRDISVLIGNNVSPTFRFGCVGKPTLSKLIASLNNHHYGNRWALATKYFNELDEVSVDNKVTLSAKDTGPYTGSLEFIVY